MEQLLQTLQSASRTYSNVLNGVLRYAVPVLVLILLWRCLKPLLTFPREPEIWAWLRLADGSRLPVTHWENVIGRSKRSDIVINSPTVAKSHGVLTRYDDGSWSVSSSDAAEGILVNGERIDICALYPEDIITVGGVDMQLQPISHKLKKRFSELRTQASSPGKSIVNLMLLTLLQVLFGLGFLLSGCGNGRSVLLGFFGLIVMEWLLLLFYIFIRRVAFELETLAFFLCTMGMCAIAAVVPSEAFLAWTRAVPVPMLTMMASSRPDR